MPRLGSTLEGAFLIWDGLLQALVRARNALLMVLLRSILRVVSADSTTEAESEALSIWLLHLLTDKGWLKTISIPQQHSLCREAMMWCCLYPGKWTQWTGDKLLEVEDEDFEEEWQEIFQASQLEDAASSAADPEDVSMTGVSLDESQILQLSSAEEDPGWMRAPVFRKVPIGVVAK